MKKIQKNKKINSCGYRYGCPHCGFECEHWYEMAWHGLQNHPFRSSNVMEY